MTDRPIGPSGRSTGSVRCGMMTRMDDQAFEWVTLFRYENVAGCPRAGDLMAV